MDERQSLIEKIREVAKTEYYLQNKIKQYNSNKPVEEWIDYFQTKNDCRLSIALTQAGLNDFE